MNDTPETESSSIIAKLREYNLWRRGSDQLAQPDPTEIGLYLDEVCDIAEKLERERDEARKDLEFRRELYTVLERERDEAMEELSRVKRQWDDARSENVEDATWRLNSYRK